MLSAAKTKKNRRFYPLLLKSLLFAALLLVILFQLGSEDWSQINGVKLFHPFSLLLAIVLVYANQWCEWKKWKAAAQTLVAGRSELRSAFFSGIGTGFLTPNGWGNFVGRAAYVRKRDRYFIVFSTFLSNVSQVLPTLLFGAAGVAFTDKLPAALGWIAFGAWIAICLLFLFGEKLAPKKGSRIRIIPRTRLLAVRTGKLRLKLFFWSNVRFLIFSLQYLLLFHAFGHSDTLEIFSGVWLLFLLTSFVPSLWSGKVLIRETAAIFVFSGSSVPVPDALLVCLLIWLINVVLPAAVSAFGSFALTKKPAHVVD
jgi:hypothetical protein